MSPGLAKALRLITFPGLVLRNAAVRLANALKIALLSFGLLHKCICQTGPQAMRFEGAFVIHWIHVSIFFPQQNVRRT